MTSRRKFKLSKQTGFHLLTLADCDADDVAPLAITEIWCKVKSNLCKPDKISLETVPSPLIEQLLPKPDQLLVLDRKQGGRLLLPFFILNLKTNKNIEKEFVYGFFKQVVVEDGGLFAYLTACIHACLLRGFWTFNSNISGSAGFDEIR